MSDIMDDNEKINKHSLALDAMGDVYDSLMDRLAELEPKLRGACIDYLDKNPDSKSALEKIELLAVVDDKCLRPMYDEIGSLRILVKKYQFRMEIVDRQLGAVQSQIKHNSPGRVF